MGEDRAACRVGSGQTFCRQSRVGSGRVKVSPGRVGSEKSDPWTTLCTHKICLVGLNRCRILHGVQFTFRSTRWQSEFHVKEILDRPTHASEFQLLLGLVSGWDTVHSGGLPNVRVVRSGTEVVLLRPQHGVALGSWPVSAWLLATPI